MVRRRAAPATLFSIAAIGLLAAVVTGCALMSPAPPTTTVSDEDGQESSLSWADYPGEGAVEPADVLAAPRAEQVEAVAEEQLAALQAGLEPAVPGLVWSRGLEGGVYPHGENGYGGATLHQTLNSSELLTAEAPDDWPALVAVIEATLAEHGYGPIEWDFDREPWGHETPAERDAEVIATNGSLDRAQMWQWIGTANAGSMWVTVMLADVDRGVGAPADAEQSPPQLVAFMVGGTVIAEADEQAYRDGVAPFEGLERPEPTHS
ncbi:hypothetical protein [Agrococcus sp. ARC_14]|uniref:hypothetical protein n=1 Tax=Agrococcus sp. ARC_14 TaxID=2919927 RepID=UPI001F061157|nr:hypothetical protein [Agrococcus sp. ARC_14]MCH1884020.1 hypothetical protein [Agrococcus sp. ARC_14]